MITKLTRKDNPEVFKLLDEDWNPIDSQQNHRRGSTFYTTWYVEIDETFMGIPEELYGFWKTNKFIWSDEDYDHRDIVTLVRVQKVKKLIEVETWEAVKDAGDVL